MNAIVRRRAAAAAHGDDYSKQYLTIEMLEAGSIGFKIATNTTLAQYSGASYSTDGGSTWTSVPNVASTLVEVSIPNLSAGDKVLWKGVGSKLSMYSGTNDAYSTKFVLPNECIVYGNIASMLYGDNFVGKTGWGYYNNVEITTPNTNNRYCFSCLFYKCNVTSAENLVIPMDKMEQNVFEYIFRGSSIVVPPALPCTDFSVGSNCYRGFFYNCSSLATAPALPATTLQASVYNQMFYNCISLEVAPDLPALTLLSDCYMQMFRGCTRLRYVKAMFTTEPAYGLCHQWLKGVAASGTFIKNRAATWADNVQNGVPSGWTVELADS